MKLFFFMGKGGVGKTTTAAAFSLVLARKGLKTLIVSLDPAHNLGDVLDRKLSEEPQKIVENLWAVEVDFEATIAKHLKQLTEKIKDIYGYLRVLNLDRYVDTLRYSPGVEEFAVLEKIAEIIREGGRFDAIVFDTPPTGLTVRMMILPFVNKMWIEKLMDLRKAILERRKAIARVLGERPRVAIGGRVEELAIEESEDPIYRELTIMKKENEEIISILQNKDSTAITMVVNPEILPLLEAKRAYDTLTRFRLPIKYLVINKVLKLRELPSELRSRFEEQERALSMARELFRDLEVFEVPLFSREPRGLEMLYEYAKYIEAMARV